MAGSAAATPETEPRGCWIRGNRSPQRRSERDGRAAARNARRSGSGGADLKPENIFLVEDPENPGGERVKILDFGIAKFLNGDPGKQTSTGMVLGTPKYISPEQCDGRDHLSGKSDVYSLGVRRMG